MSPLILFSLMLHFVPTFQQFPRLCTTREALLTKECCPEWEGDGSLCGMNSGRGFCQDVEVSDQPDGPQYPFSGLDDREKWPLVFYNRTCQCTGNFMGFNCADCKFGYFGEDCSERRESLRRNIFHLSRSERIRFISYLNLAKHTISRDYVVATAPYAQMENGSNPIFSNVSVYDIFVWMHYYVSRNAILGEPGNVWRDVDFGHWHEIRKLTGDMSFSIPYWDWRDAQNCDVCTDDLMGARSPHDENLLSPGSVFSSWRVLCSRAEEYNARGVLCNAEDEGPLLRNPGNHDRNLAERLPTSTEVEFTLGLSNYDTGPMDRSANMSFRNTLEGSSSLLGMHASVHVFMNGSMSSVQGSANDPIFMLHHAYVDSIYEQWLRRHQPSPSQYPESNAPIGHNGEYHMVPFMPLHRNRDYFISSKELGYEYSSLLDPAQRLSEYMHPYLEEMQDMWPWMLVAALVGGIAAVIIAAAALRVKRRNSRGSPWINFNGLEERQPLIPSNKPRDHSNNCQKTS
uniref:Tyrosinase n=1 Tax=Cynoglossus semilaevis TaxID=244447 RepID=A0A3P8WJV9_CYNSE